MFTQESENDSRRMTAFILILNMPKNGNGKLFFVFLLNKTVECRLSKFLKFGQLCANPSIFKAFQSMPDINSFAVDSVEMFLCRRCSMY